MNNIFNIKRFGLVLRKDLMENWRRYALLFLTMLGIMALILIWQSLEHYSSVARNSYHNPNHNQVLLTTLSFIFVICGLLFASTFMNPMNNKIKRISWLVTPASNLEKYMSRWIIITVCYIILFFVAVCIVDSLRVGICSIRYPELDVNFLNWNELIKQNNNFISDAVFDNRYLFALAFCGYFFHQSIFVLGSTFWEKSSFIKTFTAIAVINYLFFQLCYLAIIIFYDNIHEFGNVLDSFASLKKGDINPERGITYISCILSTFTLINWTLSYFRLRESEIIKRF